MTRTSPIQLIASQVAASQVAAPVQAAGHDGAPAGAAPAAADASADCGAPMSPIPDPPASPLGRGLAAALAKVAKATGLADPVEMVHDARKAMKEYRALLKLLKSPEAKSARAAAAGVARTLAGSRDRAAALESLDALASAGVLGEADAAAAAAALGGAPEEGAEAETHRSALRAFLADARLRLDYGLAGQAAAADLAAGIRRTYRRARRAEWVTPEAMHETRKSVVSHRYQMSFLAAFADTPAAGERAGEVQKLRDLFGAYQDIATLRPMLEHAAPALDGGLGVRLDAAMERRQDDLKAAAKILHAGLFERRPRAFLRDFGLKLRPEGERRKRAVAKARRVKIVRACKGCKRR